MTLQELRAAIHVLVSQTDDPEILQGIYLLLKKSGASNKEIIGFEVDGSPVLASDFIRSILEADADIEAGGGISHEEMKVKYGVGK